MLRYINTYSTEPVPLYEGHHWDGQLKVPLLKRCPHLRGGSVH